VSLLPWSLWLYEALLRCLMEPVPNPPSLRSGRGLYGDIRSALHTKKLHGAYAGAQLILAGVCGWATANRTIALYSIRPVLYLVVAWRHTDHPNLIFLPDAAVAHFPVPPLGCQLAPRHHFFPGFRLQFMKNIERGRQDYETDSEDGEDPDQTDITSRKRCRVRRNQWELEEVD